MENSSPTLLSHGLFYTSVLPVKIGLVMSSQLNHPLIVALCRSNILNVLICSTSYHKIELVDVSSAMNVCNFFVVVNV